MLKEPINIDNMASFQSLSITTEYDQNGVEVVEVLGCKIHGVCSLSGGEAIASHSEKWIRVAKIEGPHCLFHMLDNKPP